MRLQGPFLSGILLLLTNIFFRVFKSFMPMVQTIVDKLKENYETEPNGNLNSLAPVDLFKIINTVFNNYLQARYECTLRGCVGLCFKLISNFQKKQINIVNNEQNIPFDNFVAITNSSLKFIAQTRDFIKSVTLVSGMEREDVIKFCFKIF